METNARSSRTPTILTRSTTLPWHRVALIGILLLAVFLHFFRLRQEKAVCPKYRRLAWSLPHVPPY